MTDYRTKLKNDLLAQFKEQPNTESLLDAIGSEMTEIYNLFDDLINKRNIDTAEGKQLDGIGNIVVLSRKEAGDLALRKEPTYIMEDILYRLYLKYKIWKNNSNCTYDDLMKSIAMFWDLPMYYSECYHGDDPTYYPATIFLDSSELPPKKIFTPNRNEVENPEKRENFYTIMSIPIIKAAGVAIKIYVITVNELLDDVLKIGTVQGSLTNTKLPEIGIGVPFEDKENIIPGSNELSITHLPGIEE